MIFDIITLSPSMFESVFDEGIIKKGIDKGILEIRTHQLRTFATDKHKVTDDSPFGGGCGMVMKVEPIYNALKHIHALKSEIDENEVDIALLTPQGKKFDQNTARELSLKKRVVMICGRYEGVDERVRQNLVTRQISIGDYVLTGGEIAAMVVIDSVARLLAGVLGNEESLKDESHSDGLLEYAQYTRPADFMGMKVPEILLSGDHAKIAGFRRIDSLDRTLKTRPDLIKEEFLSEDEIKMLKHLKGKS